ncbi:MAG TPA: copper resistance protein NlpE N-terminal domain-containing protein [Puia sp.]
MKKIWYLYAILPAMLGGCDSGGNDKVKEPEAVVAQAVKNDTIVTVFEGVQPCKGCKQINTRIQFTRSLHDSVGKFQLNEMYINKKDSDFKDYLGIGTYKILPAGNGEVNGVALYNMALDDKTDGYIYLLRDSLTLLRLDSTGKIATGDKEVTLKKSK